MVGKRSCRVGVVTMLVVRLRLMAVSNVLSTYLRPSSRMRRIKSLARRTVLVGRVLHPMFECAGFHVVV